MTAYILNRCSVDFIYHKIQGAYPIKEPVKERWDEEWLLVPFLVIIMDRKEKITTMHCKKILPQILEKLTKHMIRKKNAKMGWGSRDTMLG